MQPVLQALLVADHVYVDKITNKKIVAGIFHDLHIQRHHKQERKVNEAGQSTFQIGPGGMRASSPFTYISLTEVNGKQDFELRYVRLNDDKQLFGTSFHVNCQNPLEIVEVVVPLPPLPAQEPGIHALELLWNQKPLGAYRISVQEMPSNEDDAT